MNVTRYRPEVKVGQTWSSNDTRSTTREFKVIEIRGTDYPGNGITRVRADYGSRKVWIKIDRFLPWQKKGYTLVADVPTPANV